jgi:prolyl-tRNA editing enzyme YbaK/EbsC (Cys-tRNA(Pro) deacylase)
VDAPQGSIVKSLVFLAYGAAESRSVSGVGGSPVERTPLLVLVSGDQRADVRRLRAVLGLSKKRLRIAQPAEVLDSTGFEVGGVPPIGHEAAVRTLIDRSLGRFQAVWAAAGSPNAVFPIAFNQLVTFTHGEVIDLIEET